MHAKAMKGLDASINTLTNSWQKFLTTLTSSDTFIGFLSNIDQRQKFCEYFGISKNSDCETITKLAIENLLSTNSNVCILTMQDILFEGSEARINTPGTDIGNWIYKLNPNYAESDYNKYLKNLIKLKNR